MYEATDDYTIPFFDMRCNMKIELRNKLSGKDFLGVQKIMEYSDIESETKTGKTGEYEVYTLHLIDSEGENFKINNLFGNDLQSIIKVWGEDTNLWDGNLVVSSKEDKQYTKWILIPTGEVLPRQEVKL